MHTIFRKMGAACYEYADARAQFDRLMEVLKAGHSRNVTTMATHPNSREEFDKFVLIFNKYGVAQPQVWHVDASGNVASSFVLLTDGVATDVFSSIPNFSLEAAWTLIGITEPFWGAASAYAKSLRTAKAAANIDNQLMDIAPLLMSDWETFVQPSATNGIRAKAGFIVSTRGAWPHRGKGSLDGKFRLVLLITSFPTMCDRPEVISGYDTELQHHRSQVCMYWWCFHRALYWLSVDRFESPDAHLHWGDHPRAQKVVKAFLTMHQTSWATWPRVPDDARTLWARALACAYFEDEVEQGWVADWPMWVPAELRAPLSKSERESLRMG
jgi:hypothetical protein